MVQRTQPNVYLSLLGVLGTVEHVYLRLLKFSATVKQSTQSDVYLLDWVYTQHYKISMNNLIWFSMKYGKVKKYINQFHMSINVWFNIEMTL